LAKSSVQGCPDSQTNRRKRKWGHPGDLVSTTTTQELNESRRRLPLSISKEEKSRWGSIAARNPLILSGLVDSVDQEDCKPVVCTL